MNEKQLQSIIKELEKLNIRKEKAVASLEKKIAKCEKLGCNWTDEEFRTRIKKFYARHEGESIIPFGNDDDLITGKQNEAYFDKSLAESNLEDIEHRIKNAESRLNKKTEIVKAELEANEIFKAEYKRVSEIEAKMLREKAKEDYEKWVKEFIEECAQDGIVIIDELGLRPSATSVHGITPNGKRFSWYINNGYTERSWHCYTLSIEGKGTVFTSGQWWLCYNTVKNN